MPIFRSLALFLAIAAGAGGQTSEKGSDGPKADAAKTEAVIEAAKNKNKKGKPKATPKLQSPPRPQPIVHDLVAMKKIIHVIEDSVDLSPTLVVWLIDRTTSAHDIVREVSDAAQAFYSSPQVNQWSADADKPLLTSIVAFDEKPEFLVDPPSPDGKKIKVAFEDLSTSVVAREMPFTAIKQVIEKYLPLRTKEHREIVLIVVTDEAGEDGQLVDELIEPLRKHAIAVYCLGLPAPWGQSNPFAPNPKAVPAAKDDAIPTVGPESRLSERVDIENWLERLGKINIEIVDSGFGSFEMERLCRATRGRFFALRAEQELGPRGVSARQWPPGGELRFDEKVVAKYAPDYISAAEYQKLINENKARAALVEAARLPLLKMDGQPTTRFPKEAEAKMATKMSEAQRFAARNLPPLDQLHELLVKGESDRPKLSGPRWQAEFDLAIGRVVANKARLDGYNSMIAALKRGKTFQKSDSKVWILEPGDSFETESTIKKLADKAKTYLERVKQEHPGTPWSAIAEEELKISLGWTWKESP
jgi:hypothetical protein